MLHIYTDGACSGNPGSGGYGVVALLPRDTDIYLFAIKGKRCENTTNNREELKGIIAAIDMMHDTNYPYEIHTDSAYCVNAIKEWMWHWAENGWVNSKKEEVKNIDLFKIIYNMYCNKKSYLCQLKKVRGHAMGDESQDMIDTLGNELADALASNNKKKFINIIKKYNIKESEYILDIFDTFME